MGPEVYPLTRRKYHRAPTRRVVKGGHEKVRTEQVLEVQCRQSRIMGILQSQGAHDRLTGFDRFNSRAVDVGKQTVTQPDGIKECDQSRIAVVPRQARSSPVQS